MKNKIFKRLGLNKSLVPTTSILSVALSLCLLSSCDSSLDIVPKGQSTLSTVEDLEMLFNNNLSLGYASSDLGIICNETLGMDNVSSTLETKNTVAYAQLAWDESVDRANLTLTDDRYTSGYKFINYMNTIIEKMPSATGDANKKKALVAEARVMRGYIHWLLVNIYAKQYDEATAQTEGGIPYVTDLNLTETKGKQTVAQVYEQILADCSDENINALPTKNTDPLRGDKAWGNAVRAKVLMQMKRYAEALPYAQKAVELRPEIEDRSSVLTDLDYINKRQATNNLIFAGQTNFTTVISMETAALFERGDYVKDYAFANGQQSMGGGDDDEDWDDDDEDWGDDDEDWGDDEDWEEWDAKARMIMKKAQEFKKSDAFKKVKKAASLDDEDEEWNDDDEDWGDDDEDWGDDDEDWGDDEDDYVPFNSANPSWSSLYSMMLSGSMGSYMYFSMNSYVNAYGITTDRMYYTLAECLIRTGKIQEGLEMVNKVRRNRIHPDYYTDLTATSEADAMAAMQNAKWIECIGTYENFFDCKRWNTEDNYKRTISRTLMTLDGGMYMFSIEPDSKLWVFPFPQNAVRKNATLTQNY